MGGHCNRTISGTYWTKCSLSYRSLKFLFKYLLDWSKFHIQIHHIICLNILTFSWEYPFRLRICLYPPKTNMTHFRFFSRDDHLWICFISVLNLEAWTNNNADLLLHLSSNMYGLYRNRVVFRMCFGSSQNEHQNTLRRRLFHALFVQLLETTCVFFPNGTWIVSTCLFHTKMVNILRVNWR